MYDGLCPGRPYSLPASWPWWSSALFMIGQMLPQISLEWSWTTEAWVFHRLGSQKRSQNLKQHLHPQLWYYSGEVCTVFSVLDLTKALIPVWRFSPINWTTLPNWLPVSFDIGSFERGIVLNGLHCMGFVHRTYVQYVRLGNSVVSCIGCKEVILTDSMMIICSSEPSGLTWTEICMH